MSRNLDGRLKLNGSEGDAVRKLEDLKVNELKQREAQLHGRLSNGQRIHRRRMKGVLRRKESLVGSKTRDTPYDISPDHGSTDMQVFLRRRQYDDAYDFGDIYHRSMAGRTNPYDRTDFYRYIGFEDGYSGHRRRRSMPLPGVL